MHDLAAGVNHASISQAPELNTMHGGSKMQFKKFIWAAITLALTAVLTSCNLGKSEAPTPDVNALYTAAAGTMLAQLGDQQTQTAAAVSPTPFSSPTALDTFTPLPTFPIGVTPFGTPFVLGTPGTVAPGFTPLATTSSGGNPSTAVGCDNATYMDETKPLDKANIQAGKAFSKGWQMQNTGTCQWDQGFSWVFVSGDNMDCNNIIFGPHDKTLPGHSNTFIVNCKAPSKPGEYKGFWQLKNDTGTKFGFSPWVDIVVPK